MAEANQIIFSHKEVVEALLKQHGSIQKGLWGLFIKFGISAANVGSGPTDLYPAAIVPIVEIGLQKFDSETNISVDAAKVMTSSKEQEE